MGRPAGQHFLYEISSNPTVRESPLTHLQAVIFYEGPLVNECVLTQHSRRDVCMCVPVCVHSSSG